MNCGNRNVYSATVLFAAIGCACLLLFHFIVIAIVSSYVFKALGVCILRFTSISVDVIVPVVAATWLTTMVLIGSFSYARLLYRVWPITDNAAKRRFMFAAYVVVPIGIFLALYPTAINSPGKGNTLLLFISAGIVAISYWLRRRFNPTKGSFILFLRRFDSFADRSVVASVSDALPRGHRLVMLLSPVESVGGWDPFLIGFSGMRLLSPFRSMPIYYLLEGDNWRSLITILITHAKCVVLDLSQGSTAIDYELNEIVRTGASNRTLLLLDQSQKMSELAAGYAWDAFYRAVQYRRSWSRSLLRIGVALVAAGMLMMFVLSGLIVALSLPVGLSLLCSFCVLALTLTYLWKTFAKPMIVGKDHKAIAAHVRALCRKGRAGDR